MAEESRTERRCNDYAKSRGCEIFEIEFKHERGMPNRLVVVPSLTNRPVHMQLAQFKDAGEKLNKSEFDAHMRLMKLGVFVWYTRNFDGFKCRLDTWLGWIIAPAKQTDG